MTELLRIATAGSVDDGKSTLIGRLLWDAKSIFEDQWEAIERSSAQRGDDYTNLALLTDGLRAEREQGITIDVAYRYFATPRRKFILADTPGHVQYTRNMVTGASTADVAIVLVDARNGLVEQSRRHAFLASLLRVQHIVLAVNKMDLVDFSEARFRELEAEFGAFAGQLSVADVTSIPISALKGDNVVTPSDNMLWYDGLALLEHLETIDIVRDRNLDDVRFPVQYVIRPMSEAFHDYRGYAGQVASGVLRKGDAVQVLPSGRRTTIEAIDTYDGEIDVAYPPMSVTVRLADDLDVSRGDLIAAADNAPTASQDIVATVCWMAEQPLRAGARVAVKHTTRTVKAVVKELGDRLNVTSLDVEPADELHLNEIGQITLRTAQPLFFDDYRVNRATGAFILIDEASGATLGAAMIGASAVRPLVVAP
jgi:bifunctional enzyme CysN/CysC